MRKIFTVARQEFRTMIRHRFYRIITVLVPTLGFLAIAGFMIFQAVTADKPPESEKVGYVDHSGIVMGFAEQGNITFLPFLSEDEARQELLDKKIKRYYVIAADYVETGQIVEYVVDKGFFPSESALGSVRGFLLANVLALEDLEGVSPDVLNRLRWPLSFSQVRLDEAGETTPPGDTGRFVFFYVISMLLLLALFTSTGTILQGLGEEKENRIMEVLLSSLTPGQLIAGKVLGLGASGLLQMVIWVVAGFGVLSLASDQVPAFSGFSLPGASALLGILYFVLGYMLFGTLFACIGAITPTAREGNQLVPIFVIPAVVPFYASALIQGDPSGVFARSLTFFPLSAPVAVMVRLAGSGIEAWEIVVSIVTLVAFTLALMWVGGRIFGAYLLMYGKRPSIKELWRSLRSA